MSEATDFGTFGRFEETAVGDMPADMKEAYDFTIKLRGLVPGPHRIWLANPELSKTVVPIGAYYQAGYSPCMRAVRHGVGRGAGTKRPGSVRRRADTQVWQAAAGLPRRLLARRCAQRADAVSKPGGGGGCMPPGWSGIGRN